MAAATVLAFDFGLRRIGVAVGETVTGSARPLTTLQCRQPGQVDWDAVAALIEEWKPAALVVGRPSRTDGTVSEMTAAAERFARRVQGRYGLPVHLMEELLSSREAEQRLARRPARTRDRKAAIDMMAATVILETWLQDNGP
ncbi:MAG: Holliday junction resolvase RuvX [Ectothiorhodospiraceae bacterium]|nr:Holliday junction resolvase RuvX [Ectothiorhodospiraceae bacterium]MCH8502749.1 Holliday junction resolvase RuvX [Ectothiorhodospiraceae bacterium]